MRRVRAGFFLGLLAVRWLRQAALPRGTMSAIVAVGGLVVVGLVAGAAQAQVFSPAITLDGRVEAFRGDVAWMDDDTAIACWYIENKALNKHFHMVARTTDGGETWTNTTLQSRTESGTQASGCDVERVNATTAAVVWVNLETDQLVVSRSHDQGATWLAPVNVGLAQITSAGISDKISLQVLSDLVWVGAYHESKAFHTTNGGATWTVSTTSIGTSTSRVVHARASDHTLTNALVCRSSSSANICSRTTDMSTWNTVCSGTACFVGTLARSNWDFWHESGSSWRTVWCDGANPARIGYGTSTDNGATWTNSIQSGTPIDCHSSYVMIQDVAFVSATEFYVLYVHKPTFDVRLAFTDDGGATWSTLLIEDTGSTVVTGGVARSPGGALAVIYHSGSGATNGDVKIMVSAPLLESDASFAVVDGRDVRTNYASDPTVYARSASDNKVHRLSEALGLQNSVTACESPLTTIASPFGLGVTVDGRVLHPCLESVGLGLFQIVARSSTLGSPVAFYTDLAVTEPEVIESFTANYIAHFGLNVAGNPNVVTYDAVSGESHWTRQYEAVARDVRDVDVEKWGSNRTALATSTELLVLNQEGVTVAKRAGDWAAVAIHNGTVYGVGAGGVVRKHTILGGTLLETASKDVDAGRGGLRVSKDGAYLVTWGADNVVRLLASSDLSVLATTPALTGLRAADIDFLNNYLYTVKTTAVQRFPVFDFTSSVAGAGGAGSENPPPAANPFTDVQAVDTSDGAPPGPVVVAPIFDLAPMNEHFGESGSRMFMAVLTIAGVFGGFYFLTNNAKIAGFVGAPLGFFLSVGFGFVPQWVVLFIFVVGAAVFILGRRAAAGD